MRASRSTTRRRLLERVVHALVEDADSIAMTISAESGKPLAEAYAHELVVSADALRWHAENLGSVLRDERLRFPQLVLRQKRGWLRYEPLGVVGIVTPWNFPLAIPLRQVAAAVAAGNAAIVKPSELTPLSGAWVEELFRRADAPPGLVRVVQGAGDVGEALVRHRGIAGVVFTGSVEVGRAVAQAAAERLCPAVLELGGKDAMLVLDDADLDRAVEGALWGVYTNCGQACAGIERIAVPPGLHDTFVERLTARASELRIGRGADAGVELGPLVSEEQRARFEGLVADAVEHGAHVATGGGRPNTDLPGWFSEPTLLLGEPRDARLAGEELFGPAASLSNWTPTRRWCAGRTTRRSVSAPACGAATGPVRARSRIDSRPAACGTTTTPTRSAPRRRPGAGGAAPASGAPARATGSMRCRTSSSSTPTAAG